MAVWSVDPLIARYLPVLSEVFRGEALSCCLTNIRPLGDARDGLEALRDGQWQAVLGTLKAVRTEFDRVMRDKSSETAFEVFALRTVPASIMLH